MGEAEKTRLMQCPECPKELPEDDLIAQIEHMETCHLEVVLQRLREKGLRKEIAKLLAKAKKE